MLAPGVAFFRKVIAHAAPSIACQKLVHWLEDVEQQEQEYPDHIYKVPVHLDRGHREVAFLGEVTAQRTEEADQQEQHARSDMRAMEASQREEC